MAKTKRRRLTKERVAKWLESRFFLRIHMSVILAGTFLAGLAATKLLLYVGIGSMAVRYVLAVCAAYLAFLALIRLWLFYVNADREVDPSSDWVELVGDPGGASFEPSFEGAGGSFGGGGATGSWGDAVAAPVRVAATPAKSSSGFGFDLDLDLDGFAVVLLFLALAGALLFAGIYVIYTAPALLSEAAFEAILAGALLRRARAIDRRGWVGAVWRATVWPFLAVLVLAGALGWAAKNYCPEATRLRDVLDCPSRTRPV